MVRYIKWGLLVRRSTISTIWRTRGLLVVLCNSFTKTSKGRIWCGGHRTLGYYDGTVYHDLIPLYLQHYEQPPSPQWPNQCRGIAQDPEGHLWFGFNYLIRFDGQSFHRYEEEEGFPPRILTSYAVGQDNTGKVWIGQHEHHREHQNELWCYVDGIPQPVQVDWSGTLRKIQCDRYRSDVV